MAVPKGQKGNFGEFDVKMKERDEMRKESFAIPEIYWAKLASTLTWSKSWDKVMDLSDEPITRWFTGGELNMCYNCLDRHVENGHGDTEILIYDSPVTQTRKTYTYNNIYHEVTHLAGVMKDYGVNKSDRVMIYMAMMAEGSFAMLACCRLGAIHGAMPSGLPAKDLSAKIDHFKPKVILTTTHGYHENGWVNYKEIIDEACSMSKHKPDKILVLKHYEKTPVSMTEGRDEDWETKLINTEPVLECVPVEATTPLFVIYTSGSSGTPKGILQPIAGYAIKLIGDSYAITDTDKEVFYMTSNFGWIAAHSYLVYMPLMMKHKTVIYEGDPLLTTDVNAIYKLIETNAVTRFFVRPGVLKMLKIMDPEGKTASQFNLKSVRQIQYTGERLDTKTLEWTADVFNNTIWSGYGTTELSGLQCCGINSSKPIRRTFNFSYPVPGINIVIRKPDESTAKPCETGRILIKLPLPPGGLISLLNDHEKCKSIYFEEFPGYFDTNDDGYLDENGGLHIEGRVDYMMKHGSIYLPAQAVEEVVLSHPDVADCAVISTPHLILKEVPVTLFIVKKGSNQNMEHISNEILEILSKHFGKAVTFGKVIHVNDLPRTPTGKINRKSITALTKGLKIVTTGVENPEVLRDIGTALDVAGYVNYED